MFEHIRNYPQLVAEFTERAKKIGVERPRFFSRSSRRGDEFYLELKSGTTRLASGSVSYFPGCCGIKIIHDASAEDPKHLQLITEMRLRLCAGTCGQVVQTDVPEESDIIPVLRRLKFRRTSAFHNPNSFNTVEVWAYEFPDDVRCQDLIEDEVRNAEESEACQPV